MSKTKTISYNEKDENLILEVEKLAKSNFRSFSQQVLFLLKKSLKKEEKDGKFNSRK
ncbi:MAG: hypothetical protein NC833_03315 [Candidatus Omnitrophica bacterium]|nr:hypothetical protein [Candidatus Omnitrophota bacterium]